MIDWNWFFSSVAQSAAAIVGIIGAFVISNVLGNKAEYVKKLKTANSFQLATSLLEKEADARYFEWYNDQIFKRECDRISDDIDKNMRAKTAAEYYEAGNFSIYADREETISEISKHVDSEVKRIQAALQSTKGLPPGMASQMLSANKMARLMPPNPKVSEERELIDALVIRIESHCEHLADFLKDLEGNPESSRMVSATLGLILALFYVGVIYPLSFMPMAQGQEVSLSFLAFFETLFSIRGFILFSMSAAFSAMIYVFYRTNRELVYSGQLIDDLKSRRNPAAYSIYLEHRYKNVGASVA